MGGLALNIVIDRMNASGGPYPVRLERLGAEVRAALEELEGMVRAEAASSGIAQDALEEYVRTVLGIAVRRVCRDAVEDYTKPPGRRARAGGPVVPAQTDTT